MNREEVQSAPNSDIGQALGMAMMSAANKSRSSHSDASQDTQTSAAAIRNVWQHPFVDVFKYFKIMPVQDWKLNKRQGDVKEIFAKEIGRKAIHINGTIPANNYLQIPHPQSIQHTLGLTGRYLYLQVKAPVSSTPFSFQIELTMAERAHGVRISASNLYKRVSTQNGFVMQVPLNLDLNRWTVVVFDLYELLKYSRLLPQNYIIEGSYQIKSMELCANSIVRGVFTSDNLYDFVTLPPDLRFKFSFEIQRWPEFFAWLELPQDLDDRKTDKRLAEERLDQTKAKAALKAQTQGVHMSNDQLKAMQMEIDNLLTHQRQHTTIAENSFHAVDKRARYDAMQAEMQAMMGNKSGYGGNDLLSADEKLGFGNDKYHEAWHKDGLIPKGIPLHVGSAAQSYHGGQYIGAEIKRSTKINVDPIMELKHIIGYSPQNCLNLKWSRLPHENIVIFCCAGVLISMDVESLQQKRFFFGHSAPICCFDVASHGSLIASAQEGKNSMIRIWDYHTARCLQMLPMPVVSLKCLSFSPDGRFLASVGKDAQNKEIIVVWNISGIYRNEKPEILARQTSHFNILCLKFSPFDNFRLVSCGKENIRFWKIRETGNISGSSVVLNQHARGTIFTCLDFEKASQDPDLRRVYVASKQGIVFQVNYSTESLESFQKINDSSIYSIACNESYCVTGSEDKFLRMWPLDMSGQVLEVGHEGTVCSLDISADGLRVVCGTLSGSLGVLDKSNQRYRTLIRAHTDKILSMDFHLALRNIITVSMDGTIRLWHMKNYEQVIEFNSQQELPLCVAAHPTLSLFSCGFQNGTIRLFDIEQLRVVSDLFTQFTKPIRSLAYSPTGDLLVAVCEDGSFAIHNARRQHMLTKVVKLEFSPQFVHVAYSPLMERQRINVFKSNPNSQQIHLEDQSSEADGMASSQEASENEFSDEGNHELQNYYESVFAVIGECGNNVMIYSSESVILKHQIQVGTVVKSFQFNKRGNEIIVVTKDQRIRFYSLSRFEGVFIKELTTVHREAIRTTDLSNNGGFMLTGGEDNLIKIWDYDAQTTTPTHFQAFIGHTYPVVNTLFNPWDNNVIFSAGERDGIFVWQFHGDMQTNYFPPDDDIQQQMTQTMMQVDRDALHRPTELEQMRATVQERRKPKLTEFSFMLPEFKKLESHNMLKFDPEFTSKCEELYLKKRIEEKLTANHFISFKELNGYPVTLSNNKMLNYLGEDESKTIEPVIMNGYDGFGGVHDNLIWNPQTGCIMYTLHNKVIIEQTKTREQTILAISTVRFSCLASSSNGKYLAAAEGETNLSGSSNIYLIDLMDRKVKRILVYHTRGIQSIAFGLKDKLILSVGVATNNHCLVFHNVENGNAIKPTDFNAYSTNKILVKEEDDKNSENNDLNWVTLGSKGQLIVWQMTFDANCNIENEIREGLKNTEVKRLEVMMPTEELERSDFLTAAFSKNRMIIGCSDGTVCAYDTTKQDFLEGGRKVQLRKKTEQITQITIKANTVAIGTSEGNIFSYTIQASDKQSVLPPEEQEKMNITELEQPKPGESKKKSFGITAMCMDDKNEEGMIGTSHGCIFFVCIKANKEGTQTKTQVKLVAKVSVGLESVDICRFDSNQKVFLANCGSGNGEVKLLSAHTLDTVFKFKDYLLGNVAFITSFKKAQTRMIGYSNGRLRFVVLNELDDRECYQMSLLQDEQLTCGCFCPSGQAWAVGTSFGSFFIGSAQKDLFRKHQGYMVVRIDGLMVDQDYGVASIQMTSFLAPSFSGQILAAFDNGQVKLWKSYIPQERVNKLREKQEADDMKNSRRKGRGSNRQMRVPDIADLGIIKFDIFDTFDMYDSHSQDKTIVEDDNIQLDLLYEGKRCRDTQAFFDPTGSHSNEFYFSFVSTLPFIFYRNFEMNRVIMKISLMHFPIQMVPIDTTAIMKKYPTAPFTETAVAVGTREGNVLVFNVEANDSSCVIRTKAGFMFGEVRGLAVTDDGSQLIVASSSGETASFLMLKDFEEENMEHK